MYDALRDLQEGSNVKGNSLISSEQQCAAICQQSLTSGLWQIIQCIVFLHDLKDLAEYFFISLIYLLSL